MYNCEEDSYLYDNDFCDWYNSQTCDYRPEQLIFAWSVWQASRATLVVKLPKPNVRMNVDIDDVRSVLDEAGIKYE